MLLAVVAIVGVVMFGCQKAAGPPAAGGDDDWYLEIDVSPPVTPKLITVEEYRVTGLLITVTDPEEQEIQVINWEASEGPQRYQIPVTMEGIHEVTVTHISQEGRQTIQASESSTFNIQAMVITEVTVVPGAIGFINIAAPAQQAANIARLQVLPEILETAETERYSMLRMEEPVLAGTTVMEDAQSTDQTPPTTFTAEEDGYLFMVDLNPGAYFEHPVRYVYVNESGDSKVFDAKWWPRVGDVVPTEFVRDTPLLKHVVERNVTLIKEPITVIDWKIRPGLIELIETEAFICVQGLTPYENLYTDAGVTYDNGYNFFDAYKDSNDVLVGLVEYQADEVLNEIDRLAGDGYDVITIYIIAHGGVNYIKLGGTYVYASQFASTMNAYPDVEFNFLLGSCHSGSFLDDLNSLSSVVIKTACLTNESAYADYDNLDGVTDYNSADAGSEWTSSILRAADRIVGNSTMWSQITSIASLYGVSETSVLMNEAGYLAVGLNRGLGTYLNNYDLTNRTGYSTPDHYASWEALP